MQKVLTIAGSDSGGGAGIQADLKVFSALGVYGTTVITSITAQNTLGIAQTQVLSSEIVSEQIDAVLSDIGANCVKTGMLGNDAVVSVLASKMKEYKVTCLVVDPVIVAKGGKRLITPEGVELLKKRIFPIASLVTPNKPEAEILSGIKIESLADMKLAAKAIAKKRCSVLIKGGHFKQNGKQCIDLLFHEKKYFFFEEIRLQEKNSHGTGCVLSSAIAAFLAKGYSMNEAVGLGKQYVTESLKRALPLGSGIGPVDPMHGIYQDAEKYRLLLETEAAYTRLKQAKITSLIPEIQTNLVAALPKATTSDEVIGFPGRIIKVGEEITTVSRPVFGASSHVARIVLTAMRFDPSLRSSINLKYDKELVRICKGLGFRTASFSRKNEPKPVQTKEGSTLEWGISQVLKKSKVAPEIIYDTGGHGKEPIIRVIAATPGSVADKVLAIHAAYKK